MFRVKICGVTRPDDAVAAADAGADAIGLNFYEGSPRCVDRQVAREIARAVSSRALVVGVFVNESVERINEVAEATPLGAIQLHGDETPDDAAALDLSLPVVRAFQCRREGLAPLRDWGLGYFKATLQKNEPRDVAAYLVDAPGDEGEYGGTGRTANWRQVATDKGLLGPIPLILAGGLKPENVAEAIERSGAVGVDTASGVETLPGIKDPALVAEFVSRARFALSDAGR